LSADALARLAAEHRSRGGLVSVQPFHLTEQPYESLSAVCNVVELMGTGAFSAATASACGDGLRPLPAAQPG